MTDVEFVETPPKEAGWYWARRRGYRGMIPFPVQVIMGRHGYLEVKIDVALDYALIWGPKIEEPS